MISMFESTGPNGVTAMASLPDESRSQDAPLNSQQDEIVRYLRTGESDMLTAA